jgi:hypothetical protein
MIKIKGHLGQPGHGVEEKELGCIPIYLTFARYGQEEAEDLNKVGRGKRKGRGRWRGRGSDQKN